MIFKSGELYKKNKIFTDNRLSVNLYSKFVKVEDFVAFEKSLLPLAKKCNICRYLWCGKPHMCETCLVLSVVVFLMFFSLEPEYMVKVL